MSETVLRAWRIIGAGILLQMLLIGSGCATIRVTDPYETATQQFLESEASRLAVQRVMVDQLRDRKVFVDTTFLSEIKENSEALSFRQTPQQYLYLVAELRAKLLMSGVRLVNKIEDSEIIVEPRTGGVGVDHEEYLFGLASVTIPSEGVTSIPITTPELAILKSTKQFGFASVAFVAYWRDTGEVVANSGPFIGRTSREDYWILGYKTSTLGNIPPAQPPPPSASTAQKPSDGAAMRK
jgi:hypothetical protein